GPKLTARALLTPSTIVVSVAACADVVPQIAAKQNVRDVRANDLSFIPLEIEN
ncbi:MAG: hypothetical protein ICV54_16390, partial [Nostoc sp. C3-bin3]|nr:hypothetical protein [Nostoc sp. C3-bin3]